MCPLGLYWALARNTLVGASCKKHCCAKVVTGRVALPCSLRGDWHALDMLAQDVPGVGSAAVMFEGLVDVGPWRSLAKERQGLKRRLAQDAEPTDCLGRAGPCRRAVAGAVGARDRGPSSNSHPAPPPGCAGAL